MDQIAVLKSVRQLCELHPAALDFAMADQIEHLSDLLDATERNASEFFAKNYVTGGMHDLLRDGLGRLDGQSDQAVLELRQAMGGGKTHSMLALGLIARNPSMREHIPADVLRGIKPVSAKVVAITGRSVSHEIFVWGEIAQQLGKGEAFARFWRDGARAPNERDWIELLADQPVLILLDELPPYFDNALTISVGSGNLAQVATYALSNLLSAALKLPRCCVVLSNLSGTYQGASQQLRTAIRNFEQEANRQARPITPVELASSEVYEILKKRLFKKLPSDAEIEEVARAYARALAEAVKSKSVARSAQQIVDEIRLAYPFHPSVKQVIALFKENESYRQTRGLMLFASKMLKSVWAREADDVYLVGCQHLDLHLSDVREMINRISNVQNALATDIASNGDAHAELVDKALGTDAGSQVASLLLTASLSESVEGVKGLTTQQMLECLIAPDREAFTFQEAFEKLRSQAWYLHRKENDAWYFANVENLRKRIDNRAEGAPQPKVDAEMKRRLEEIFQPRTKNAYEVVQALPKLDEIHLNGPRVCIVLSPDSKAPPQEAQRFFDDVTEKNNFCLVTGDGSTLASLEEKTRRIWAIARVREETGGDRSPHAAELDDEAEIAEQDFNSTVVSLFNRVYYPMRRGLTPAKLSMTFTANEFRGEEQVEKALKDIGASKLIVDMQANAESLLTRAEDMLWPGSERRTPWRDIVARSIENPRWTWLPPRGLDGLKDTALKQGRWRDHGDGYIEKPPFPPSRTDVTVVEKDYDDRTGESTLIVTARDAGKLPRIVYAKRPDALPANPMGELHDEIFKTDEVKLFFLALDPDGKHETGEPKPWTGRLTIRHQPSEVAVAGKRSVELSVVPKGEIRWNTAGITPRDGEIYRGPIELEPSREVTLYAYAEADGVTATREFVIPAIDRPGPSIDPTKPAKLKKRIKLEGTAAAYRLINRGRALQAKLAGVGIEIGEGARALTARFGSESVVGLDELQVFIEAGRAALGDPTADIRLTSSELHTKSGHDLETILKELGLQTAAGEVEQQP